jgi:hypothetical protein
MSYNYSTFQSYLYNQVAAYSSDTSWGTEFPLIIDRAEQACYRDLDLLSTRVTDSTGFCTAGSGGFTLPTSMGTFLVVEEVKVWMPAGVASSQATQNILVPTTRAFINMSFPTTGLSVGTPRFWGWVNNVTLTLGPIPDSNYQMVIVGTQRPTPLSATNTTTILTTMLPDLFFAAAMVEASMFMRDYGGTADNPGQSVSWASEYERLLKSAKMEEMRKKMQIPGPEPSRPPPKPPGGP